MKLLLRRTLVRLVILIIKVTSSLTVSNLSSNKNLSNSVMALARWSIGLPNVQVNDTTGA
jgi:hypothetical protein